MEQERSEKLVKHLKHIREMVDYLEVSGNLLTSGIISPTDHQSLLGVVMSSGNTSGMEELVQILRVRRNGCAAFVNALRANDYNWLAGQMDPDPITVGIEEPSRRRLHGILRRSRTRNSEARMSAETVFTSYRQSFPMDLSASSRSLNQCHTLTKSFDSLYLQDGESTSKPSTSTSTTKKTTASSALLLNIPEVGLGLRDTEIVSKIAAEFNFPLPECLASLKRINVASKSPQSKSKKKKKVGHISGSKTVNLKIKFKSKDARDRFVDGVNSSCSDLGGIKGVPLDSKSEEPTTTSTTFGGSWFRKLLKR